MIDLHCHILPGLDDGAADLDESLAMARAAAADGIRQVAATPHVAAGADPRAAGAAIAAGVEALSGHMAAAGLDLALQPGAELAFDPRNAQDVSGLKALSLDPAGRFLLVEFPYQNVPRGVPEAFFALRLNGLTPVIAHPERNLFLQELPAMLEQLVGQGALVQITAMSLTGRFGERVRLTAEGWLARRLVHVIATDAHDPRDRAPILSPAVDAAAEVLQSYPAALDLVTRIPAAILRGERPEVEEPRAEARGRARAAARW